MKNGFTLMELLGVIVILPVVALIIHLFLFAIVLLKKLIKSQAERLSGKKIVSMSLMILIFMAIFIGIVYMIAPNKYIEYLFSFK